MNSFEMTVLDVANTPALHEESLLQIPLVRSVLADPSFRIQRRAIDANWFYAKKIPVCLSGFNPFEAAFFYAQRSAFAEWLANPPASARDLNENDFLAREVMFMVHDYLHAWTYQMVDRLWPDLGLFGGEIPPGKFEDFVFVHLLSEAVATMGLDYWYLCVRGINSYCPIGTTVGALTVSYRENLLPEYRRFQPGLVVQDPSFFHQLAEFYCDGTWNGFDVSDLKRSPILYRWLEHELEYGTTQRRITRAWLSYLQGKPDPGDDSPVAAHCHHALLIEQVGQSLWRLIKEGQNDMGAEPWKRGTPNHRKNAPSDFRFLNLVKLDDRVLRSGERHAHQESFRYFVYQLLSRIPLEMFPEKRIAYIPWLIERCDTDLVLDMVKGLDFLAADDEPLNLIVLN